MEMNHGSMRGEELCGVIFMHSTWLTVKNDRKTRSVGKGGKTGKDCAEN